MVKAILRELNDLESHDDRQKMFDDQLWGLILMSHFKVAKGLTEKEIQLYLLRQEKHISKKKQALAARHKRNIIMKELLYICFRDWTTSKHDSNDDEKEEDEEEEVVVEEEEEEGYDNSAGKAKKIGVVQLLIKEKRLNGQDAKALRKYEQMFLAKAGML
jgi:hypothetical protein